MEDMQYASLIGQIRAREAKLFTLTDYHQLVNTDKIENIYSLCADTDYAPVFSTPGQVTPEIVKTKLTEHLQDIYSYLRKNSFHRDLTDLVAYQYDLINLFTLLHSTLDLTSTLLATGTNQETAGFSAFGTLDYTQIKEMYSSGKLRGFTSEVQEIINTVMSHREEKKFAITETVVNQQMYNLILTRCKKYNLPILEKFYRTKLDLINLTQWFNRMIDHKLDKINSSSLLNGGLVPVSVWLNLPVNGMENLSSLATSDLLGIYQPILSKTYQYWQTFNSVLILNKLLNDYLTDTIRPAKYLAFSVEPLFGYIWAKETEIQNLNLIFTAKWYNLPPDQWVPALNKPYIGIA